MRWARPFMSLPTAPIRCMLLMVAQDTGGAIRGAVRGDIFFGFGAEAERRAGRHEGAGHGFMCCCPMRWRRRLGEATDFPS